MSTFDEPASSSLSGGQWPRQLQEGEPKYSLSTTKRSGASELSQVFLKNKFIAENV